MWQRSLASLRPARPLTSLVLYFLNFERRQKRAQNLGKYPDYFPPGGLDRRFHPRFTQQSRRNGVPPKRLSMFTATAFHPP
jgi:hypothetical protein